MRRIEREMNEEVDGLIRGKGKIWIIIGKYYEIGMKMKGINLGIMIGFFEGIIRFIKYIGYFVGMEIEIGVEMVKLWKEWIMVWKVEEVFLIGKLIEGNIIKKKIVGY